MRLLGCVLTAFVLFQASGARSADGSSGCGPAWYVFKENSIVSSMLRVTTNGMLFPVVTLGMTFGTSNCTKHSLVLEEQRSLHFATQSYDLLRQDISRGSGQHLNAYIASFGCSSAVRDELAESLQASFHHELYLTTKPESLVEAAADIIKASPVLAQACS